MIARHKKSIDAFLVPLITVNIAIMVVYMFSAQDYVAAFLAVVVAATCNALGPFFTDSYTPYLVSNITAVIMTLMYGIIPGYNFLLYLKLGKRIK